MLNSERSSGVPALVVVNVMSHQKAFLYMVLAGMRWAGRVARMGARKDVYRMLMGKETQSFRPHCGSGVDQPLTELRIRNISWVVKVAGA
jgi:hypothetical protein